MRLLAQTYDLNPGLLINNNLNIVNKVAAGREIKALYTSGTFARDLGSFVRVSPTFMILDLYRVYCKNLDKPYK